jgi:hypothetical protein
MLHRLIRPFAVFDDETTSIEPGATAPPAVTPPAEPAEPAAGPWAADLEAYFEDPTARSQADKYLREKIQPRMTQLEQQQSEYAPAREFFDDLRQDPVNTTLALIAELYDDGTAEKVASLINAGVDPAEAAEAVTGTPNPTDEDPVLAEMRADYQQRKTREVYDSEMARVRTKPEAESLLPADDKDAEALFAVFVSQEEGDFDKAFDAYKRYSEVAARKFGTPPVPPPADPPPPSVLGTQPGGSPAATPPVQQNYSSLDDALDAFMDERRAQGVTPVGTV